MSYEHPDRRSITPLLKIRTPVKWIAEYLNLTVEARIRSILRRHAFDLVKPIRHHHVYLVESSGRLALFKRVDENGFVAHSMVLRAIQGRFKRLLLPQALAFDRTKSLGRWVILDWHDGRAFSEEWDPYDTRLEGGRAISLDTVPTVLDMIEDLRTIDPAAFSSSHLRRRTREWLASRIRGQLDRASRSGWLTARQVSRTAELLCPFLDTVDQGRLGLSNNDFQFRNFVFLADGRVKLIDWDAATISTFETEHCIAYQWMLMWNNEEWQRVFLASACDRLHVRPDRLRAACLIMTLNHSVLTWKDIPTLRHPLLIAFQSLLEDESWTNACFC